MGYSTTPPSAGSPEFALYGRAAVYYHVAHRRPKTMKLEVIQSYRALLARLESLRDSL